MYRRLLMMASIPGEGNQGTINKALWRIPFIDTRQQLEGNYAIELKKGEKWRQKLLVRFSIDLLNWVGLNLSELPKIEEHKGNY